MPGIVVSVAVPEVLELVSELVPELLWAIAVDTIASDIAAAKTNLCFI